MHNLDEKAEVLHKVILFENQFLAVFFEETRIEKIKNQKLMGGIATDSEIKCTKRRRIRNAVL
jgi:hypothetical protein